jgi:hypothetical protein
MTKCNVCVLLILCFMDLKQNFLLQWHLVQKFNAAIAPAPEEFASATMES